MSALTLIEAIPAQVKTWAAALQNFDGVYELTRANLGALAKLKPQIPSWPPAMQRDYTALVRSGLSTWEKLKALKIQRDKIRAWLESIAGKVGLSALGVLPAIYVAAGVGAFVSVILLARSFLTDSQSFAQRVSAYQEAAQRAAESGATPEEAAAAGRRAAEALAPAVNTPGVFERLGTRAIWILGAVALLYVALPALTRSRR